MKRDDAANTLIVGCTELLLLIELHDFEGIVLDTTRIHIETILDAMMGYG